MVLALLLMFPACQGEAPPPVTESGRPVDILVEAAAVLTMDDDFTQFRPGFVAISGEQIVAVGPLDEAGEFSPARRLVAGNGLVLPGLINGHQHAAMALFRGLADDLELMEWLTQYVFPAEAENVNPEFVYWGTKLAAVEMVQTGTTTFADMYYYLDEVARAAAEVGMRSVAGQTLIGFPAPDFKTPEEGLEATEQFIQRWKDHPLIVPAVAPHAPYTLSREVLLASKELADRTDVPLLIHLAETEDEVRQVQEKQNGLRPIEYLKEIGFLSPRVVAAHGVWAQPHEIGMLKEAGVGVVHNPESNMKLASGTAPVPQMLEAGIDLGLGTDGAASNNNLDLFEAMDFMAKLHKLVRRDPTVVSARQTLRAATLGGARAIGLGQRIGSLEPGKQADLILCSLDGAGARPFFDPYSMAVYSLKGASVRTVIIHGKVIMEERQFPGLDLDELYQKVAGYQDQVRGSVRRDNEQGK